jgi:hypothetical protein
MTIERKVGMGIAGQPTGSFDVAEVFSTQVYKSDSTSHTINNGIDLAGEGGLVWTKGRHTGNSGHALVDTVRGNTKWLGSDEGDVEATATDGIQSFTSTGYTLGAGTTSYRWNHGNTDFVSWTFRKKEKFFDIVTWSGNDTAREIPHSLDGPVGMILVKSLNANSSWTVFHRSVPTCVLDINDTGIGYCGGDGGHMWGNGSTSIAPTDTVFSINAAADMNKTGRTYVAYVFADNSSEDADDQMIKCGSYVGTGASVGATVNLGWEPQWLLIKPRASGNWSLLDTTRGIPNGADNTVLRTSVNSQEQVNANWLDINPTGFKSLGGSYADGNASGVTYIYMAIRAPMMKEPEAATDVFAISTKGNSDANAADVRSYSGFTVDMFINRSDITVSDNNSLAVRRTHSSSDHAAAGAEYLYTNSDAAALSNSSDWFNASKGIEPHPNNMSENANHIRWMWKRAKGFFDVVAYSGTSSATTVAHSLGVAPEMMWLKQRGQAENWQVYNSESGNTKAMRLNMSVASYTSTSFNNTTPTSTVFSVDNSNAVNGSGRTYIALLFATLPGISKVGSFVGNGTTQTIDCGFSAGARFLLIKGSTNTQNWYVFDSLRGIVARPAGQPFSPYAYGLDAKLQWDNGSAQFINVDFIDPHNSGFIVNAGSEVNGSGVSYIFYAIA